MASTAVNLADQRCALSVILRQVLGRGHKRPNYPQLCHHCGSSQRLNALQAVSRSNPMGGGVREVALRGLFVQTSHLRGQSLCAQIHSFAVPGSAIEGLQCLACLRMSYRACKGILRPRYIQTLRLEVRQYYLSCTVQAKRIRNTPRGSDCLCPFYERRLAACKRN